MPSSQKQSTIHFVVGPTASGKTAHAIKLAKELIGELINADSRQIYKYLDIGTNKEPSMPVPIHLTSFLEPDQQFSVYEYRELAVTQIRKLIQEDKVPIVVGGTGLWVDALLHPENYKFHTDAARAMREELQQLSTIQLQQRLQQLDPTTLGKMNESDSANPRRLIRAIEKLVPQPTQEPTRSTDLEWYLAAELQTEVHYLQPPLAELTIRINQRVVEMWENGLVSEVKQVLKMGYPANSIPLQGVGYREVLQFLSGELDEKSTIQLIQLAHRHYAKRQITWFKKYL